MNDIVTNGERYEPFTIYLYDVSYYSGKVEMLLRYKEVPFKRIELTMENSYPVLYKNTGVMKVPAIETADGQWLKDSTPMIDWFDGLYPESAVVPDDPALMFLSKLVEDYADEWLWRPAMYYRWKYDHKHLGARLGSEIATAKGLPLPAWLRGRFMARRQIRLFMKKDGVNSETAPHIEQTYLDNLAALESILRDSPFLLGNRPTLADFGYMGPMFRHFSLDPTPARIMREKAPGVYEWVARMWNCRASDMDRTVPLNDFSHRGWEPILRDISETYLPSLRENYKAWKAGKEVFDYKTAAVTYRNLPVVHYRVWCMEELQRLHSQLPQEAQNAVESKLSNSGGLVPLLSETKVNSGIAGEFSLPLKKVERRPNFLNRLKILIGGTPWDMPRFDTKKD